MAAKTVSTRIVQKHDLEVNWSKANNFIPMRGEVIVYDIEVDADGSVLELPVGRTTPYKFERIKIGDGIHAVGDLKFVNSWATFVNDSFEDEEVVLSGGDAAQCIRIGIYNQEAGYTSWDELISTGAIVVEDGAVRVGIVEPASLPTKNEYGFYFDTWYTSEYGYVNMFRADGSVCAPDWEQDNPYDHPVAEEDVVATYGDHSISIPEWGMSGTVSEDGKSLSFYYNDGNEIETSRLGYLADISGDLVFPLDGSVTTIPGPFLTSRLTSVIIPGSIAYIGESAFASCENITSAYFGDGVTEIASSAFNGTGLTTVSLPDSVTTLGEYAFSWVPLESVQLSKNLTSLSEGVFVGTNLTEIKIPASVTSIGWRACPETCKVYYEGTVDQWNQIDVDNDWFTSLDCSQIICSDGEISIK